MLAADGSRRSRCCSVSSGAGSCRPPPRGSRASTRPRSTWPTTTWGPTTRPRCRSPFRGRTTSGSAPSGLCAWEGRGSSTWCAARTGRCWCSTARASGRSAVPDPPARSARPTPPAPGAAPPPLGEPLPIVTSVVAPVVATVAEPAVPGERMAAPYGATRAVPDYGRPRASYVFLALVSILSLAADVASKSWAEHHLDSYPGTVEIWKNHVTLLLAKNRGGAWGLLQSTSENVRRPFFLLVSVAAIAFIMTLYRRLQPRQLALKWGLPLVLGGAPGHVFDRIRYGHVIDFIDYRADWMRKLNETLLHNSNDHWPTFNIAHIAICVGVR